MIQFLPHKNINFTLWDDCILKSQNPLVYGLSWYLDVVCNRKWDALVLGNYDAVMPLCYKRKWTIHYVYPPMFAQQLGVFSKTIVSNRILDIFLKYIPLKFKYLEMCINTPTYDFVEGAVDSHNLNTNIVLNLQPSYSELYQKYSTSLRRNLKKIETDKLSFSTDADLQKVIDLFKNAKGLEYPDMGSQQYQTLKNLNAEASKQRQSWCVGVSDTTSNELLAGALFILTGERIIFLFSGVSARGKEKKAMFFLIDQVIQLNAGKEMVLDFDGSNNVELARFYQGFGGEATNYLQIASNRLPNLLKWLKK